MENLKTNGNPVIKYEDLKQEFFGPSNYESLVYKSEEEIRYLKVLAMLDKAKAEISRIISRHRIDYLQKKTENNENNKN